MRTVEDFIKAKACLCVTCRNCDHEAFLNGRFLKERLGPYARIADANFRCAKCQSRNVKLSAAAEALSEPKLDPRMHFAGVYAKYLD